VAYETARSTLAHLFEATYLATQLHMGHVAVKLAHTEETATVYIAIGEIIQ
jgi:hypothetical protein